MNIAMVKNIDIIGVNWGAYKSLDPRVLAASMNELYDMFAQNKLAPVIGQTFPFEKALEALECLRQRRATGKIVVTLP
jgi:NADPH2:quinone reductase